MERLLTPEKVLNGEIAYSIEQYAKDLKNNVQSFIGVAFAGKTKEERALTNKLWLEASFTLCLASVNGYSFEYLLEEFQKKVTAPNNHYTKVKEFFQMVHILNFNYIQILKALLERIRIVGIRTGITEEDINRYMYLYVKRTFEKVQEDYESCLN